MHVLQDTRVPPAIDEKADSGSIAYRPTSSHMPTEGAHIPHVHVADPHAPSTSTTSPQPSLSTCQKADGQAVNSMTLSSVEREDHVFASICQAKELAASNGYDEGYINWCTAPGGLELLASALKNAWNSQNPIPEPSLIS